MVSMNKITDKMTFSNIEKLFILVMLTLAVLSGIVVFSLTTQKRNVSNFKHDTAHIVSLAKNAIDSFDVSNSQSFVKSDDGKTKGMCITLKGLEANDIIGDEYKDWDGYIVAEISEKNERSYAVWITNGKYVIDGYDSQKISELTLDEGITKYNDDSFSSKVKTSFTGTSGDKGGTGSSDGKTLNRFEAACVNEKVE